MIPAVAWRYRATLPACDADLDRRAHRQHRAERAVTGPVTATPGPRRRWPALGRLARMDAADEAISADDRRKRRLAQNALAADRPGVYQLRAATTPAGLQGIPAGSR